MLERLKEYIQIPSVSGDEQAMRSRIINDIKDYCEYSVDKMGNIIAFKKGANRPKCKLMLDAHMDEIGLIITYITDDGYLKFSTVGGIDNRVLFGRRVRIGEVVGVIGGVPVHMLDTDQRTKIVKADDMYIDIGVSTKEQAEKLISLGDTAVFDYDFRMMNKNICARGIDDKVGCAILVEMIKNRQPYDMYFTFTTGEEVGCRGAVAAAYNVNAESAIVVEATTAADLHANDGAKSVCCLGGGAVVSFMDNGTVYDKQYYTTALTLDNTQPKTAVAGGNNSSAIHKSRGGVRTLALSLPCRYIHSQCSVANVDDIFAVYNTATKMAELIASGKLCD